MHLQPLNQHLHCKPKGQKSDGTETGGAGKEELVAGTLSSSAWEKGDVCSGGDRDLMCHWSFEAQGKGVSKFLNVSAKQPVSDKCLMGESRLVGFYSGGAGRLKPGPWAWRAWLLSLSCIYPTPALDRKFKY